MSRYQYYPTYPHAKLKAFTVSYDDGITSDEKLCTLLRKYHAKGTFNLNSGFFEHAAAVPPQRGWRRLSVEEAASLYGEDMEIALHGQMHPYWSAMDTAHVMQDILNDKRWLEESFGRIIRGGAYPFGAVTDESVEILRLAGLRYCRTTGASKSLRLNASDPLRFQGTIRNRDEKIKDLARKFADMTSPRGRLQLLYIWGHSYEFVQDESWDDFEQVLSIVCNREDTWYCTNIELFDYLWAAGQLRYNAAQTMVENPTATDIWLRRVDPVYDSVPELPGEQAEHLCIPAGKTVKIPNR